MNRWLAAGLVVSLLLNLVAGGFLVGRYYAGASRAPVPPMGLRWMLDSVPDPERREALRPLVREGMREFGAGFEPMRRSQEAVHAALVADVFDAALLDRSLADTRRELDAMQSRTHATLVRVASAMTPTERRALAEALRRPFSHPDRGERGRRDRDVRGDGDRQRARDGHAAPPGSPTGEPPPPAIGVPTAQPPAAQPPVATDAAVAAPDPP